MSWKGITALVVAALVLFGSGFWFGDRRGEDQGYRAGFRQGYLRGIEKGQELGPPPIVAGQATRDDLVGLGYVIPEDSEQLLAGLNRAPAPCPSLSDEGVALTTCVRNEAYRTSCPSCGTQLEFLVERWSPGKDQDWLVDRARREVRWDLSDQVGTVLGGAGPIPVVVFTDYQCPYCGRYEKTLERLIEKNSHIQVRVVQLPLSMHQQAEAAARAALAADQQGAFAMMHRALFAERKRLDKHAAEPTPFGSLAQGLGLDIERFASDYTSEAIAATLSEHGRLVAQLAVTGTPTVFVDGIRVTSGRDIEQLEDLVRTRMDARR